MKIKRLILGLSGMGLLATTTPISSVVANQATLTNNSQDIQIESLPIFNKLREIESINKSCEKLVSYETRACLDKHNRSYEKYINNIESRIKIEDGIENPVKDGKIERDDLFTYTRTDTQYTSYHRYKSNHVEKNNHTSWGNAKKYQLNVIVPANIKEYKVQVVADVKIKNCIDGWLTDEQGWVHESYSFVQAKLSQLSISPQDILMPYIGIKDENTYEYNQGNFKLTSQNNLFRLFKFSSMFEYKPYEMSTLNSVITLSNETPEAKEIPVYFWYGFFGGGYYGLGPGSHINCSEVTFSANHIEW